MKGNFISEIESDVNDAEETVFDKILKQNKSKWFEADFIIKFYTSNIDINLSLTLPSLQSHSSNPRMGTFQGRSWEI